MSDLRKILLLGSGALKIGQAGEFDYSGSQALKAFKEEGITTVLINPNIATIQTSKSLADKIYFLPVTTEFVIKVIEKERPDVISLSFGGQTALNCGLELEEKGILKKYNIKVLGTPVSSIKITEDRELFAKELKKIDVKVPRGGFATTLKQSLKLGDQLGFPLLVRSGYSLGGLGSAVANSKQEFISIVENALRNAPQIAIEEYLKHWKEIEYEVVRDANGNKITVCNMENFDPLGIHTGESIVVAPSQTLNNYQYHFLRKLSLLVIEQLGIVGECNIQFALNPLNNDYRVIEVNARLSRSSALASKATGYPLAYIAAKIGMGYLLPNLKNTVTGSTSAFFEPALDYIVIKMPRWDLQKFIGANLNIGSEMKSVGEVMAIGRSFPEVLQKAIRMLETGQDGLLNGNQTQSGSSTSLSLEEMLSPSTHRLFEIAKQFAQGISVDRIYKATGVDKWFLHQLSEMVEFEKSLSSLEFSPQTLKQAKQLGFSDKLIAKIYHKTETEIRIFRRKNKILPKVKHIDTLAAEYPAKTNYLYLTYHGEEFEDVKSLKLLKSPKTLKAIVLGSGPYRIGSSVEFDWCCVTSAQTLKQKGIETVIVNCNPETVSTDYDMADKLYFEELTFERVSDIYELETDNKLTKNVSLVLSFGGQVPNNIALKCFNAGMKILGTSPLSIDQAEDRHKFSKLLDTLGIEQPLWQSLKAIKDALIFADKIGYPVLVRPSYVLSGSAMNVAYCATELEKFLRLATDVSSEHPVVISKFIDNAKEIEIDGVGQDGQLLIYAISEHIENAGVHSGDATLVLPAQRMYLETMRQVKVATKKILRALQINGPFNIQFLAKDNKVSVIELNLRASRSFPFVSKVTNYNFVDMATRVMLGEKLSGDFKTIDLDHVGVKASQFSFNRIKGADPILRVEMSSTGEVGCFGDDLQEAFLKAMISTGFKISKKGILLAIGGEKNKLDFLQSAESLVSLGLKIYATEHTSDFLTKNNITNQKVYKISEDRKNSILNLLQAGKVDLVINISVPDIGTEKLKDIKIKESDGFILRRSCVDLGVPLVTNLQTAQVLALALASKKIDDLEVKSWDEYTTSS